MKAPNFTAVLRDGTWTCAYVGDDAEKAKATYTDAVNANDGAAMLFVRPQFTRRFRGQPKAGQEPVAPAPEPEQPKAKKGGK
jgi:hypothetical protein